MGDRTEYMKQYRLANKERIAERDKKYRQENKEALRQYYLDNREHKLEYMKEYHQSHKEGKSKYDKVYRQLNKESISEYKQKYNLENKDAIAEQRKNYHQTHYEYIGPIKGLLHPDGSFQRTRSKSEAYWLSVLDEIGLEYISEIPLKTSLGTYWADCYIVPLNIFIEIKADYYIRKDQMDKIEELRENGVSIVILDSDFIDEEYGF